MKWYRPFWVALLKKLFFFCPCQLFFCCFKTQQPIHQNAKDHQWILLLRLVAHRNDSKNGDLEIPFGNSVRNPCGSTQPGWFAKGPNKNILKLAWLFKGQKESPWPCATVWPDGVMMSSCPWCPHHVTCPSKAQDAAHHMYAGHQKYPLQLQIEVDKWGKKAMVATMDLENVNLWVACLVFAFFNPLRCGSKTLLHICTLHSQTWQQVSAPAKAFAQLGWYPASRW